MRKDELIKALLKVLPGTRQPQSKRSTSRTPKTVNSVRRNTRRRSNGINNGHSHVAGHHATNGNGTGTRQNSVSHHRLISNGTSKRSIELRRTFRNQASRILKPAPGHSHVNDRLVAEPQDSHWIRVSWAISQPTMQRAEAALGIEWRQAVPILRLYDITEGDSDAFVASWVRDVEIHGEVQSWYVPVEGAPRSYRLHIGYVCPSGHFFLLARSNIVKTPRPGTMARNGASRHDGQNSSGKLAGKSPNGRQRTARNGAKSNGHSRTNVSLAVDPHWVGDFPFEVHAELVVHGTTHPNANLTLLGEEVQLEADGSFSLCFALPDGRQVIPAVAVTPNGAEQRTIVLGVERNTRQLEPRNLNEPL
jgi:hypothetical protein